MTANRKTLMRSLGECVGHVWRGIRTDITAPPTAAAPTAEARLGADDQRPNVREPGERVILRRTTIDEVVVQSEEPPRS
ncbi:MAG: hypothetical protein SFZ24_07965 [Planctomycetota bacterium]|nr:hypothetical protein [Planctomycetota bacterium]